MKITIGEVKQILKEETRIYDAYTRTYKRLLDSLRELRDKHGLDPHEMTRQALIQLELDSE